MGVQAFFDALVGVVVGVLELDEVVDGLVVHALAPLLPQQIHLIGGYLCEDAGRIVGRSRSGRRGSGHRAIACCNS